MFKRLKIKGLCALTALLGAFSGQAFAQIGANTQLSNAVMKNASGAEITSILSELGVSAAMNAYDGDGTATMVASTSGGAQFFISFFNCADAATATDCSQLLVYTGLPNSGVTYDDINTFNTNSDVSKAINVADQQIIIFGTQLFLNGGLGRQNVQLILKLFLTDMQRYVDTQIAQGTAVSLRLGKAPDSKVENLGSASQDDALPVVQFSARATNSQDQIRVENALSAAIANTFGSRFADDNIKAAIE